MLRPDGGIRRPVEAGTRRCWIQSPSEGVGSSGMNSYTTSRATGSTGMRRDRGKCLSRLAFAGAIRIPGARLEGDVVVVPAGPRGGIRIGRRAGGHVVEGGRRPGGGRVGV